MADHEPRTAPLRRIRRAFEAIYTPQQPLLTAQSGTDDDVVQMIGAIGPAMLSANQPTTDVEQALAQVARAYGRPHLTAITLPTLVLVQSDVRGTVGASAFPVAGPALRLDQAGAIQRIVDDISDAPRPPAEVIANVAAVRQQPPRFHSLWAVLGHTVLTLGFGLVLNPTLTALPAYVLLGAAVGVIVVFGSRIATLASVLPVVTAFLVTIACIRLLASATGGDALLLIAPPLLSFLPGMMLTIAAVELTSGQIIAGASRFIYGVAQLALLAFGVTAGVLWAGELPRAANAPTLGWWAPWVGIVLVGVGFLLYSSAPRGSLGWIVLALAVAYAAQTGANLFISPWVSGFFGAVALVPFARAIRIFRSAPPPIVTTTSGFWILVPGALGFMGVAQAASGEGDAGQTLVQVVGSIIAIALGMLVGSGLSRDLVAMLHAWTHRRSADPPAPAASPPGPPGSGDHSP